MSTINLDAFRAIANGYQISDDQQVDLEANNGELAGLKNEQGEAREVKAGEPQKAGPARYQLLNAVKDQLGGEKSEAFRKVKEQLCGPLNKKGLATDASVAAQPLLGRDLKSVLAKADAATAVRNFFDEVDNFDLFDEIAATSFGKWEGKKGGNGYMAIGEDGAPIKFLTHSDERKDIGKGLSEKEQKCINDATERLQNKLTEMAKLFGDADFDVEVANLLKPEEKGALKLLSRKSVAKVVDLIAAKAKDIGITNLLNWDKIERADTLSKSTIEEVFGFDLERLVATQEAKSLQYMRDVANNPKSSERAKDYANIVVKLLEMTSNPSAIDAAAARVETLLAQQREAHVPEDDKLLAPTECHDVELGKGHVKNLRAQFKVEKGYTMPLFQKHVAEQKKLFMQIFADGHYFGCGIPSGWETQEEMTLKDLDLDMFAYFLKQGVIKKSVDPKNHNAFRFEYNQLSTVDGGYKMNWRTPDGKVGGLSFFSCPSLSARPTGFDVGGNLKWMVQARKKAGLKPLTKLELRNAEKYLKTIYKMQEADQLGCPLRAGENEFKEGKKSIDSKKFRQLMQLFIFDSDKCVFSHRSEKAIKNDIQKLVDLNNKLDALPKKPNAELQGVLDHAKDMNFKTLKEGFAKMIAAAREAGAKQMIIGPSGLGAFFNEGGINAQAFMEAINEEGEGIEFIFSDETYDETTGKMKLETKYFMQALDKLDPAGAQNAEAVKAE